MDIYRIK